MSYLERSTALIPKPAAAYDPQAGNPLMIKQHTLSKRNTIYELTE